MYQTVVSLLALVLYWSVSLVPLNGQNAVAETIEKVCISDSYVGFQSENYLVISDFAVTRRASNCPTYTYSLDQPISIRPGAPLHFWFRLQGDDMYLNHRSPNDLVYMHVSQIRTEQAPLYDRSIKVGNIKKNAAKNETSNTQGVFDWRLRGWRTSLLVPGRYVLWLEQSGKRICHYQNVSNNCTIEFVVTDG